MNVGADTSTIDIIVDASASRFLLKFGNAADADVNIADFKPGRIIDDAGDRQAEDSLEIGDGPTGIFAVDAIGSERRQRRIGLGYPIQLLLHLANLGACGADSQIGAGP